MNVWVALYQTNLQQVLLQDTSPACTLIDKAAKWHIAAASSIFSFTATIIIRHKCVDRIRINLTQTQRIKHI